MDSDDIDWDSLKTIATFDGLNESSQGSSINGSNSSTRPIGTNIMDMIATKATTPISLLVESLVQQLCTMIEKDPTKSSSLYNSICEQLHRMNLIDETYSMGEFEMMRSQYQRALYQLVSVARGQDLPEALQTVWPLTHPIGMDWSRYHREFDETGYIAGGGFGKVFKARHKLDGIEYAVKKITIKSTTISKVLLHLAEVRTLASLNHINIVPYKAAWLEPFFTPQSCDTINKNDMSDDEDEESDDSESKSKSKSNIDSLRNTKYLDESSDFIQFEHNSEEEQVSIHSNHNEYSESFSKITSNKFICKYKNNDNNSISIEETQPHIKLKWSTLYIQMTLCQLTLRQWLDERNKSERFEDFYSAFVHEPKNIQNNLRRNSSFQCCSAGTTINSETSEVDVKLRRMQKTSSSESNDDTIEEVLNNNLTHLDVVMDIFGQLLNGLCYIHSRGIVHHDIKPSNIFICAESGSKLVCQLGDFGLACPLQKEHDGGVFGTPLYAAPEQLSGQCNAKSDIYSLGIILLELLLRFNTDMERVKTIEDLRKGKLPDGLTPCFAYMLKKLLLFHRRRPDTQQVIEMMGRMSADKELVITELQRRLSERDTEILELRSQYEDNRQDINNKLIIKHTELVKKREEIKVKNLEIISKNNEIKYKNGVIEELKNKITHEIKTKDELIKSKDDEINRLKKLLNEYHK